MVKKSVHFVGIAGSGLSAISRILLEKGYKVSGSDRQWNPLVAELQAEGANIYVGHNKEHVLGVDLVIRSSAIPENNVEVQAARAAGIPVLKRSEFLDQFLAEYRVIAIAGTHGKTTTTAMIAWLLSDIGQDPSFVIGGVSKNLKGNAHAGNGKYFVIEADEYDQMFLGLSPQIAVITNIEYDHPDCYPTREDFYLAFKHFSDRLKQDGFLVTCSDDRGNMRLFNESNLIHNKVTYGFGNRSKENVPDYQATNIILNHNSGGYTFDVYRKQKYYANVALAIPGKHNVLNALASVAVADAIQIPISNTVKSIARFIGTERRFDIRGEVNGVTLIDDYAHHPHEIRATIAAVKDNYPNRRLWIVWQPHTYSRIQALWDDFIVSFDGADKVILMEIFAAREVIPDGFSTGKLASAIRHENVQFIPEMQNVEMHLRNNLKPSDVLLVLSAGDANKIIDHLMM